MKYSTKYFVLLLWSLTFLVALVEFSYDFPLNFELNDSYGLMGYIREIGSGRQPLQLPWTPHTSRAYHHFDLYLMPLGYLHRLFSISPITLLYFFGLLNTAFFVLSAYLFLSSYFDSKTAVFILFSMLFLWGSAPINSGVYYIMNSQNFIYPQGMAYSFLFMTLFFLEKIKDDRRNAIYCIFFGVMLFLTHILTGFLFFAVFFLYLVFNVEKKKKSMVMYGVIPLVIILLSMLWPYYSMKDVFLSQLTPQEGIALTYLSTRDPFGDKGFLNVLITFKIGLIGVIGLYHLFRQKRYFFPAWYAMCMLLYFVKIDQYPRFLYFSAIPLHVGAGILLYSIITRILKDDLSDGMWHVIYVTVFAFLFQISYRVLYLYWSIRLSLLARFLFFMFGTAIILVFLKRIPKDVRFKMVLAGFILILVTTCSITFYSLSIKKGLPSLSFIEERTPQDAIILTEEYYKPPFISYKIPGLTGRRIIMQPLSEFFGDEMSDEERIEFIKKYDASYVLIYRHHDDLRLEYPVVFKNENFTLYKITGR